MTGMRLRTVEREAVQNGTVIHNMGNYSRPVRGFVVNPDLTVSYINGNLFEQTKKLYEDWRKDSD